MTRGRLTKDDVVLARRLARAGEMPFGWISDMARDLGVTTPALVMAINGSSWKHIKRPAPVTGPRGRKYKRSSRQSRPRCPTCGHAKHYAVMPDGSACVDAFHSIDHRRYTSGYNFHHRPAKPYRQGARQ